MPRSCSSAHAIIRWIINFEADSAMKKNKLLGSVRTILKKLIKSHKNPASFIIMKCHYSWKRMVQDLHYHLCKLQMIQELKLNDHLMRWQFCEWVIVKINKDKNFVNKLWMSEEAHFHLNGFINKQYFCNWAKKILLSCFSVRYKATKW